MVFVQFKVLEHGLHLGAPEYGSEGAAGIDLYAAVNADYRHCIPSMEWSLVPTGIAIQLPKGFEAQIRPRSGLAAKHGITVLNSPGTIDSDYRGEVKVLLINFGEKDFFITRGDKIAQMVIMPVPTVTLKEVKELTETKRGEGGFGSTGGVTDWVMNMGEIKNGQ